MREPNQDLSSAVVFGRIIALALTVGLVAACASLEYRPAPAGE